MFISFQYIIKWKYRRARKRRIRLRIAFNSCTFEFINHKTIVWRSFGINTAHSNHTLYKGSNISRFSTDDCDQIKNVSSIFIFYYVFNILKEGWSVSCSWYLSEMPKTGSWKDHECLHKIKRNQKWMFPETSDRLLNRWKETIY